MKVLNVGSPIGSFACDSQFRLIAVGGRDVLKLVEYSPDSIKNYKNLRNKAFSKNNTNFIDWNPRANNLFATATVNGSIHIWDVQGNIK
jgi:hypothetical protein